MEEEGIVPISSQDVPLWCIRYFIFDVEYEEPDLGFGPLVEKKVVMEDLHLCVKLYNSDRYAIRMTELDTMPKTWYKRRVMLRYKLLSENVTTGETMSHLLYFLLTEYGTDRKSRSTDIGKYLKPGCTLRSIVCTLSLTVQLQLPDSNVTAGHVNRRPDIRTEAPEVLASDNLEGMCDFNFVSRDNERVPSSRLVMSMSSPVLRVLFNGSTNGKDDCPKWKETIEVKTDASKAGLEQFNSMLMTQVIPYKCMLLDTLLLSREYMVANVIEKWAEYASDILENGFQIEDTLGYYRISRELATQFPKLYALAKARLRMVLWLIPGDQRQSIGLEEYRELFNCGTEHYVKAVLS